MSLLSKQTPLVLLSLLVVLASLQAQDDLRSQLSPENAPQPPTAPASPAAPTDEPPAPTDEPPALPHESLDPTPHLPGLPSWLVNLLIALAVFTLILLAALIGFLHNLSKQKQTPSSLRNPYHESRQTLLSLKDQTLPLAELATRISLTIRRFLADSRSDPSLFETREEFLANHERLRSLPTQARNRLEELLETLSACQYAPPSSEQTKTNQLLDQAIATLDGLASNEPLTGEDHD
ncbi:MAG: hypothetical protein AAGC74_06905 [Verrucomicrobiota bacterium]